MDIHDLSMPTVTVSIVTYKRAASFGETLRCLSRQNHTDWRDIRVSIVNDGSDDEEYRDIMDAPWPFEGTYMARDRDPEDRPTLYSSRNISFENSMSDVFWLLDDDLRFDEHTLFILRLYHMMMADQRPVLVPHLADQQEPWHYQNPFSFCPPWKDGDRVRPWVCFAGLSLRREDWNAVGGIDLAYDLSMGFADMDLGIRLHKDGCNVCQVDGVTVFIQDQGKSWRTEILKRMYPNGMEHRNGLLFKERWPEYASG